MITVKEVAKLCEVSPSTVSNILNGKPNVGEETRQRVLQTIKETGYQPNYFASGMRKQNSKLLSIIVEDLNQFTTPPIVGAIMSYCEEKGYKAILMDLRMYDRWQDTWFQDEKKLISVLNPAIRETESIKADGCIYVAGHGRGINYFPKHYSVPTVIAYAKSEKDRFPSVLIDDENGGYDMGKYLISMGHKKICIITGTENNMHTQKRLAGYQRALFEAGIPYNPNWTFHGDWKKESGYQMAERVLEIKPTVICHHLIWIYHIAHAISSWMKPEICPIRVIDKRNLFLLSNCIVDCIKSIEKLFIICMMHFWQIAYVSYLCRKIFISFSSKLLYQIFGLPLSKVLRKKHTINKHS